VTAPCGPTLDNCSQTRGWALKPLRGADGFWEGEALGLHYVCCFIVYLLAKEVWHNPSPMLGHTCAMGIPLTPNIKPLTHVPHSLAQGIREQGRMQLGQTIAVPRPSRFQWPKPHLSQEDCLQAFRTWANRSSNQQPPAQTLPLFTTRQITGVSPQLSNGPSRACSGLRF